MDAQLSELARDIDATCRLSGEFTLRSGLIATEYFDKYRFETKPELLRRVAEAMVPLLPADTDALGGLELGGVPIATMLSSLTVESVASAGVDKQGFRVRLVLLLLQLFDLTRRRLRHGSITKANGVLGFTSMG